VLGCTYKFSLQITPKFFHRPGAGAPTYLHPLHPPGYAYVTECPEKPVCVFYGFMPEIKRSFIPSSAHVCLITYQLGLKPTIMGLNSVRKVSTRHFLNTVICKKVTNDCHLSYHI